MARYIQAVHRFGPRIEQRPTLSQRALHQRLALTTGLRRSQVAMVLMELSDALVDSLRDGVPTRLEGLGRFRVTTDVNGKLRLHYLADPELRREFHSLDGFQGKVASRGNVGLSPEDFKALWDEEFPDDPLEMPRLKGDDPDGDR